MADDRARRSAIGFANGFNGIFGGGATPRDDGTVVLTMPHGVDAGRILTALEGYRQRVVDDLVRANPSAREFPGGRLVAFERQGNTIVVGSRSNSGERIGRLRDPAFNTHFLSLLRTWTRTHDGPLAALSAPRPPATAVTTPPVPRRLRAAVGQFRAETASAEIERMRAANGGVLASTSVNGVLLAEVQELHEDFQEFVQSSRLEQNAASVRQFLAGRTQSSRDGTMRRFSFSTDHGNVGAWVETSRYNSYRDNDQFPLLRVQDQEHVYVAVNHPNEQVVIRGNNADNRRLQFGNGARPMNYDRQDISAAILAGEHVFQEQSPVRDISLSADQTIVHLVTAAGVTVNLQDLQSAPHPSRLVSDLGESLCPMTVMGQANATYRLGPNTRNILLRIGRAGSAEGTSGAPDGVGIIEIPASLAREMRVSADGRSLTDGNGNDIWLDYGTENARLRVVHESGPPTEIWLVRNSEVQMPQGLQQRIRAAAQPQAGGSVSPAVPHGTSPGR